MRVKHTGYDFYYVYSCLKGSSIDRWWPHKIYQSKQAALKAIERIRDKEKSIPLKFKVVWNPRPYCKEEDRITVYEEN